jgi:uncharacterized protein YicC (UPF0701 family)
VTKSQIEARIQKIEDRAGECDASDLLEGMGIESRDLKGLPEWAALKAAIKAFEKAAAAKAEALMAEAEALQAELDAIIEAVEAALEAVDEAAEAALAA